MSGHFGRSPPATYRQPVKIGLAQQLVDDAGFVGRLEAGPVAEKGQNVVEVAAVTVEKVAAVVLILRRESRRVREAEPAGIGANLLHGAGAAEHGVEEAVGLSQQCLPRRTKAHAAHIQLDLAWKKEKKSVE